MRVSDICFLAPLLVLVFLICIWDSDLRRALGKPAKLSDAAAVRDHSFQGLNPARKISHNNLEQLALRKLLMKTGSSQAKFIAATSSHGGSRKRGSWKRRTDADRVGAFTEDYRAPRQHPPRNN